MRGKAFYEQRCVQIVVVCTLLLENEILKQSSIEMCCLVDPLMLHRAETRRHSYCNSMSHVKDADAVILGQKVT